MINCKFVLCEWLYLFKTSEHREDGATELLHLTVTWQAKAHDLPCNLNFESYPPWKSFWNSSYIKWMCKRKGVEGEVF